MQGYHCTRLTVEEINNIRTNGMILQNSSSLKARIARLQDKAIINDITAQSLKTKNKAGDSNRANMLWFCFFEPFIAGEGGISRFFRYWGGEALYSLHEDTIDTSVDLQRIGIPCVIKVKVPIKSLKDSYFPDFVMIRAFLKQRGHHITNPLEHEGYSIENIPSENVMDIIEYPSNLFIELTKCNMWTEPLLVC